MAQHQRRAADDLWEISPRRIALEKERKQGIQQEYRHLLEESRQQKQRPQTGPLTPISISDYSSWYEYVNALEQQRKVRERQQIRRHAQHMNTEHDRTQRHIANILSHIDPDTTAFHQPQNTDEMSLAGIAAQETISIPAVSSPPERSRETQALLAVEEISPSIEHAIRLFMWQYHVPPTHIRLSSYNYRQLALEYNNQTVTAYTNQRGTFFLIPDYTLDDQTIVCEEHVMQQ